jgi:hypothetical protein
MIHNALQIVNNVIGHQVANIVQLDLLAAAVFLYFL